MKRNKIYLTQALCRRGCGKTIMSACSSLLNISPKLKEKYEFICKNCITQNELHEMLDLMARSYKARK